MTANREPRWWFVAYATGLGVLVGAAAVLGGQPPWSAVSAVALLAGFGIAMANTPYGRLRARSHDERERSVNVEAVAMSGSALSVVVLAAFIIELASGRDGMPWAWLAAVAGGSYLTALVILNARR